MASSSPACRWRTRSRRVRTAICLSRQVGGLPNQPGLGRHRPVAGSISVTLFNAAGARIGTAETYNVAPYGQNQINDIFAAVGAPATETAYAVVRPTVPLVAYASVVDNRTGDPVAVLAQRYPPANANLFLSGVARAAGVGSSLWRTDVRILGVGGSGGNVTLAYHPKNQMVISPTTESVFVGSGTLVALDDVMSTTFGMSTANGGLHITATVPLIVLARTYNQSLHGHLWPVDPSGPL